MPQVYSAGARIHYHDEGSHDEGSGPPLVLLHGFSDSLYDWYEAGYVDALRDGRRLLLIDCRGHGRSDKPHAPEAYSADLRVADVLAVMDDAGVRRADFWGYSMGGRICFAVANSARDRVDRMILAGIDEHGTDPRRFDSRIRFLSAGIAPYLDGFEARFGRMQPPDKRSRFLQNDSLALIASSIDLRDGRASYDPKPSAMTMRCLLYDGDADVFHDGAMRYAASLPDAEFVSLPTLDHGGVFTRSDMVLPHVLRFLENAPSSG